MKADKGMKLDVVIDGVRYRSATLLDLCTGNGTVLGPYSRSERWGVAIVRVYLCRSRVVVETYSMWDDGTGHCVGTRHHVADQHELERLYSDSSDPVLLRYVRQNAVTEVRS